MKTVQELEQIRQDMKKIMKIRNEGAAAYRVVVRMGDCGLKNGARDVLLAFGEDTDARGMDNVIVTQCDCTGNCANEPVVTVYGQDGKAVTYVNMTAEKAHRVVEEHLANGRAVDEYIGSAE